MGLARTISCLSLNYLSSSCQFVFRFMFGHHQTTHFSETFFLTYLFPFHHFLLPHLVIFILSFKTNSCLFAALHLTHGKCTLFVLSKFHSTLPCSNFLRFQFKSSSPIELS